MNGEVEKSRKPMKSKAERDCMLDTGKSLAYPSFLWQCFLPNRLLPPSFLGAELNSARVRSPCEVPGGKILKAEET